MWCLQKRIILSKGCLHMSYWLWRFSRWRCHQMLTGTYFGRLSAWGIKWKCNLLQFHIRGCIGHYKRPSMEIFIVTFVYTRSFHTNDTISNILLTSTSSGASSHTHHLACIKVFKCSFAVTPTWLTWMEFSLRHSHKEDNSTPCEYNCLSVTLENEKVTSVFLELERSELSRMPHLCSRPLALGYISRQQSTTSDWTFDTCVAFWVL